MAIVRSISKSIGDFVREGDRAAVKQTMTPEPGPDRPGSMDRRELPVDNKRGQENTEETSKAGTPWGFFLVLAAILVVAIVYSVSILALKDKITPETVFGAMAACFTVIGTLVGTYFGIKAGLDGQDKLRQTLARTGDSSRERPQEDIERNRDRRGGGQQQDGLQGGTREHGERRHGEHKERQGWDGGGV